jgi:hypothetical protein
MGKESIVEIPPGSGNRYRYLYEGGQTKYLGPVGSAPPINEESMFKLLMRPTFHVVNEIDTKDGLLEIGWVNRGNPDFPQLQAKVIDFYNENKRDLDIELGPIEEQKPEYVAMLDGEIVGVVWTLGKQGDSWYREWVALGMKPGLRYQTSREFARMFTDEMVSSIPRKSLRSVYQLQIAPMEDPIIDSLLDECWDQSEGHPNNFLYIIE